MSQLFSTLKGWVPDAPKAFMRRRLNDFQRHLRARTGCLPDFIILGTQKGGTTSLYRYLIQHPHIHTATRKEIGYFNKRYERNLPWYRTHFPTRFTQTFHRQVKRNPFITGEADPAYILDPHALHAIRKLTPGVKLILLLRDPVQRAWSHYRHALRLGVEQLGFEAALDVEEERIEAQWTRMMRGEAYTGLQIYHYAYQRTGHYAEQIDPLLALFPRDQMLIMKSEDLFVDPPAVVARVVDFLGLPAFPLADYRTYNKGVRDDLDIHLRQRLDTYFEPHNQRLLAVDETLRW
jgi:hypothetical protein